MNLARKFAVFRQIVNLTPVQDEKYVGRHANIDQVPHGATRLRETSRSGRQRIVGRRSGPEYIDEYMPHPIALPVSRYPSTKQRAVRPDHRHELPAAVRQYLVEARLAQRFAAFDVQVDEVVGDQVIDESNPLVAGKFGRRGRRRAVPLTTPAGQVAGVGDRDRDLGGGLLKYGCMSGRDHTRRRHIEAAPTGGSSTPEDY